MATGQSNGAAVADDEYEYHPPPAAAAPKAAAGSTSFRTGPPASAVPADDEYEYHPPSAAAEPKAAPTEPESKLTAPIDTEAKSPISRTLSSAGGTVIGALSHPIDTAKGALESLGDAATLGLTKGSPLSQSVDTWLNPKTRPTWEGIKSVLPEALGQGIGNVALGEAAGVVAPPIVKGIGRIPDAIRDKAFTPPVAPGFTGIAAENLAEPLARRGAEKIFRGVRPAGGEIQFRENLAKALPDLAEVERNAPLGKSGTKGGIINPDMRIRQTVDNIDNRLSDIWKEQRQPQIDRNADAHTITREQLLGKLEPDEVKAIEKKLDTTIPENMNLQEADNMLKTVNARLRRVEGMDPQSQALAKELSPTLEDLDGMKKTLHGAIGKALEDRGETGIREFNQRYGALSEVRNALRNRMNPTEATRLLDDVRLHGGTRGLGILERLHITPSPGRLVQKGLEGLSRSELRPPATPPPPLNAPRALLPPPTPVLAPNVDTSGPIRNVPPPMVWTPEMRDQIARQTAQAPPNAAGQVTGIGSVVNPQAVGPRGTAGTRFAPKGLLPGPIAGTPVPQVGTPLPVGFPARIGTWEGFGLGGPGWEPHPGIPITQAPPIKPMVPPAEVPRGTAAPTPVAPREPVLPGMEEHVAKQAEGAAKVKGEDLTREANTPKDINAAAGEMETKSPLFRGTAASPQKEIFGGKTEPAAATQSKPLHEEYTPEEIEEAKLLLKSEVGGTEAGERPRVMTHTNEMGVYNPQKIQSAERGIFAGGELQGVGSGRNLYPFLKAHPEYTASMIKQALERPNAPSSQKMLARAAEMVRDEKLSPEEKQGRYEAERANPNRPADALDLIEGLKKLRPPKL